MFSIHLHIMQCRVMFQFQWLRNFKVVKFTFSCLLQWNNLPPGKALLLM